MVIPLVLLLSATLPPHAQPAALQQPVHVWVDPAATGVGVRVYVETQTDGYLMVLRRWEDGTVDVLFPEAPWRTAFTSAGTYEVMGSGGGAPFTVLAALAPDPFHTGEFTQRNAWDRAALGASRDAGPESALTELVQRMLGDESFNYDVATYGGPASLPPRAPEPPTVVVLRDTVVVPGQPAEQYYPYYYEPLFWGGFAADGFVANGFHQFHGARLHALHSHGFHVGGLNDFVNPTTPALAVYQGGMLAGAPSPNAAWPRPRARGPVPAAAPVVPLNPTLRRATTTPVAAFPRRTLVPIAARATRAAPVRTVAAAARPTLPPIVIVQHRVRSPDVGLIAAPVPRTSVSRGAAVAAMPRVMATAPVMSPGRTFAPAMTVNARPVVATGAPMTGMGMGVSASSYPRTFSLPHSVPAVIAPYGRR